MSILASLTNTSCSCDLFFLDYCIQTKTKTGQILKMEKFCLLSFCTILMIAGRLKGELCGIKKRFEKVKNGIYLLNIIK